MGNWLNFGMGNVDLECGMECFINGAPIGYTQGDCSITCSATKVDLYQGQPAKKVGSRISKIEGTIKLACLEQTPEIMQLASTIGHLVKTSSQQTRTVTGENCKLNGTQKTYLQNMAVTTSSIVLKDPTETSTYTLTTDYTVGTEEDGRCYIQRVTTGAIEDGEDCKVSYTWTEYIDTPYLFYGAARKSIEVEKVVFHKVNPDAETKQHHIVICWRAVAQGDYSFKYNQDSASWMAVDVELGLLSDEENTNDRHNLCPLFMETWQDSFDVNNLPTVPETYTDW